MEQSIIVESPLEMHFCNRPVSYGRISILDSVAVSRGGWKMVRGEVRKIPTYVTACLLA